MDFIAETERFNKLKQDYENKVRTLFDEDALREIIDNKCITDNIYYQLEKINIYNDFDENFVGKYDVEFDWAGVKDYQVDSFYLIGYYWDKDLSGTQTNKTKEPIKFNVFEFLEELNRYFSKTVI